MLAGADLVGSAAIGGLSTERPRTVRVNSILQAMEVKTVRPAVRVDDVNLESLPGVSVDHCARYATVVWRLVDVSQNDLVRFWYQVRWIKILAVNQRRDHSGIDFRGGNCRVFVSHVAHAVTAIVNRGSKGGIGTNRRVVRDGFDFQVDMSRCHGECPFLLSARTDSSLSL